MADTSYQPKVYHKQGGDIEVVASGGKIEVETGGEIELTGETEVQSGGEIEVLSGAEVDMQSGSNFKFYDTEVTADKMRNIILSLTTHVDYYRSGAVSFFNVSQLAAGYGYHAWSGDTTMSLGSVTLPLPDSGQILFLDATKVVGDGNLSVLISTGTSMIDMCSVMISAFELSAAGWAKLINQHSGCWTVVEANYDPDTEV